MPGRRLPTVVIVAALGMPEDQGAKSRLRHRGQVLPLPSFGPSYSQCRCQRYLRTSLREIENDIDIHSVDEQNCFILPTMIRMRTGKIRRHLPSFVGRNLPLYDRKVASSEDLGISQECCALCNLQDICNMSAHRLATRRFRTTEVHPAIL